MAKKLHLNIRKSHPSTKKKLENGAQALSDWPSHGLVRAGGSCKMGRAGEDHAAITQPPCQGLGASLGAAGSQHIPQGLQLLLDSRQSQLCAPCQEKSSLLLNKTFESHQAFAGKQQHRKAQGIGRSVTVTPWTRLGGRAGNTFPATATLLWAGCKSNAHSQGGRACQGQPHLVKGCTERLLERRNKHKLSEAPSKKNTSVCVLHICWHLHMGHIWHQLSAPFPHECQQCHLVQVTEKGGDPRVCCARGTCPALCPKPSLPCWALTLQPLALQPHSLTLQSCYNRKAHPQLIHTPLVREAPGQPRQVAMAQWLVQGHPAAAGASTGCCDGLVKGSGCSCPWAAHYLIPCSKAGSQSQQQPELMPNLSPALLCHTLQLCHHLCAPRAGGVTAGLIPVLCPQPGPCSQSPVPREARCQAQLGPGAESWRLAPGTIPAARQWAPSEPCCLSFTVAATEVNLTLCFKN